MSVCERYGDAYLFKYSRYYTHLLSHNMPDYPTIDIPDQSAQDSTNRHKQLYDETSLQ